jgi:hypothetical protein
LIRHDPRPRLMFRHNQTNERSSRQSHDQPLLSGPVNSIRRRRGPARRRTSTRAGGGCWHRPAPAASAPGKVASPRRPMPRQRPGPAVLRAVPRTAERAHRRGRGRAARVPSLCPDSPR